jgi:uncharacterized GH25 family protein
MMKKSLVFGMVIVLGFLAQGHEFWMQPLKFHYTPGETAIINFMVGENFVGEVWELKRSRLVKVEQVSHKGKQNLIQQTLEGKGKHLDVKLEAAGTHLVVMQSHNAFIELEADAFNEYLKEDGLDDTYNHRKRTNTLDKPATEFYARCTKLLLQVGDKTDDTYKQVAGLPLEIVPVQHPYSLQAGDEMSFLVLYEGKPSPFTLVKVWNRKNNNTVLQNIYTQKDGIITTRLSNTGPWMVSCVKMVSSRTAGAEWQSYWSSLVFGY